MKISKAVALMLVDLLAIMSEQPEIIAFAKRPFQVCKQCSSMTYFLPHCQARKHISQLIKAI